MDATAKQVSISDTAELDGGLSDRPSQKEALAELGQRALLSQDLDDLLHLAVGLLREVLEVEFAEILHQPAVGDPLVLVAASGWQDHIQVGITTVPCDRNSRVGYTLLSNEPVIVEDLRSETRFVSPPPLLDHGVIAGMSVAIQGRDSPYGVLGVHSTRRRRFTDDDADFLRSVANIVGLCVEHRRSVERVEQSARYETALAECAQSLLAEDQIQNALEALLVATEATYVFLERNVNDPELGLCSQVVAEAVREGADDVDLENDYWDLVPWDRMPTLRRSLEEGKPVVVIPEELEGPEYDIYAADPYPVKSELELPIMVNAEWAGLIGFADQAVVRQWSDTDVSLLTTTARMIGAFWEREASQDRLQQLIRSKDDFLATVSHELRTPLTVILGLAEEIAAGTERFAPAELVELTATIAVQSYDMAHLIEDLLVAARADIGKVDVESACVDLRKELDDVVTVLQASADKQCQVDGEALVWADSTRVRQIIRNLLTNAERYGGPDVIATIRSRNEHAELTIRDNGQGIPGDRQARIFEPYEHGDGQSGRTQSIGIGLTVSRQLARLMKGDLTYRFDHGASVFTLVLPAVQPQSASDGQGSD